MPENDPILRIEYEARNQLTQSEIQRLSTKFDLLNTKFDSLAIDMTTKMGNIKTGAWKYVASILLSFISGGGALGLIEYLLTKR